MVKYRVKRKANFGKNYGKIQILKNEIQETENKLTDVTDKIDQIIDEIDVLKESIAELERKIAEREDLLKERARVIQLSGEWLHRCIVRRKQLCWLYRSFLSR